ncbi:HlyD family secretion protein [Solimonas variicoloris]|uniref:HlyD family secretion protein n=1 Tax=Solimonas variicoloris TaxID=254408 RepID=UPI00037EC98F|nr:HlyD family efflux transporter periplasmic adaptor subunit [Solimonas variicoloris]
MHRYRRFAAASVADLGAQVELSGGEGLPRLRLSADDYRLAQLFDGARGPDERLAAARALGIDTRAALLEGLADRLARAQLLQRGTHEPLPVPAQSVEEARELGWLDGHVGRAGRTHEPLALPPSSMPGSRLSPGLLGGLAGLVGQRGRANHIDLPLSPGGLVALGRPFAAPLASRAGLYTLLFLVVTLAVAFYQRRFDAARHVAMLAHLWPFLGAAVLSAYLVNLVSMAARAAAVARYTPSRPRVGLRITSLYLPALFVDTAGPAEHAGRATRLRIVGSPLVATFGLFVLATLLWFLTHLTQPRLAAFCVATMAACVVSTLIRINPIARRDGYFLLLNAFGVSDLRETAALVFFGFGRRPWQVARREVPASVLRLYAWLVGAFWLLVAVMIFNYSGRWLVEHLRGVGFLLVAAVLGVYMVKQMGKTDSARSSLGWTFSWWPFSEKTTWIAVTVLLIGLIPYPYEPSGDMLVLPRAQADVRALVAGDIREVLVKEGDTVETGQVIVRLADDVYTAKVAASEAQLASLKSDLALAQKGGKPEEVEVARQAVATARTKAEFSRINAQRLAQAYQRKAVTSQEYDRARGQAEVDAQLLREAEQQLALVSSPAASDRLDSIRADLQRVEAELKFNRQQLGYTEVKAPIAGRIVSGTLQFAHGNYLNVGERVAIIEDAGTKRAEIKMPESSIGAAKVGNAAWAKSWAYPWHSFAGTVSAIAPAAEDSPYGKVVRVEMEVDDPQDLLKSGMTGSAKVDGGWSLAGVVFTRALVRFVFVEVWSWLP